MPYLFRAYSDDAAGINTSDMFGPQTAKTSTPVTSYEPINDGTSLVKDLRSALANKKIGFESPFIFFTASFVFAMQVARTRYLKGEANVRLTAIDTRKARTAQGGVVEFIHVPKLLEKYGNAPKKSNGEEKDYRDVFLSLECIVIGPSAGKTASFDDLVASGLYRLYPALEWDDQRGGDRTRLNRNTEKLRAFHFQASQPLNSARIGTAAKCVAQFAPSGGNKGDIDAVLLAHLLACRKRCSEDQGLMQLLEKHFVETVEIEDEDPDTAQKDFELEKRLATVDVEEVTQSHALVKLFADREIPRLRSLLPLEEIAHADIVAEKNEWEVLWSQQREHDFHVEKGARLGTASHRKRRFGNNPGAGHLQRRADRKWLPRDEYRAKRESYRASRGIAKEGRYNGRSYQT